MGLGLQTLLWNDSDVQQWKIWLLWCKIRSLFKTQHHLLAQSRHDSNFPKETHLALAFAIRFKRLSTSPGAQGKKSNNRPFQIAQIEKQHFFLDRKLRWGCRECLSDVISWSINKIVPLKLKAEFGEIIPIKIILSMSDFSETQVFFLKALFLCFSCCITGFGEMAISKENLQWEFLKSKYILSWFINVAKMVG